MCMHIRLLCKLTDVYYVASATATSSYPASVPASLWHSPQVGGLPRSIVASSWPSCLTCVQIQRSKGMQRPAKYGSVELHSWQVSTSAHAFLVFRVRGQRPSGAAAGYHPAHRPTASILAAYHAVPVRGCGSDGGHGGWAVPAVPQLARPGQ